MAHGRRVPDDRRAATSRTPGEMRVPLSMPVALATTRMAVGSRVAPRRHARVAGPVQLMKSCAGVSARVLDRLPATTDPPAMETRVLHDPGVGWARPVRRPEPPSPSVGRTLAAARRARRLSLREVADTMGMPPSRLAGYENGEQLPQPVTLRRLCAALGLTPSVLLRLRLAATTGKGRSVEDDHDSGIDAGPDDRPGRNRVADLPDIDPLTGLPGPAWLERRAAELIGTIARHPGTRAVGLLIGIDGFARVNDALGRPGR